MVSTVYCIWHKWQVSFSLVCTGSTHSLSQNLSHKQPQCHLHFKLWLSLFHNSVLDAPHFFWVSWSSLIDLIIITSSDGINGINVLYPLPEFVILLSFPSFVFRNLKHLHGWQLKILTNKNIWCCQYNNTMLFAIKSIIYHN